MVLLRVDQFHIAEGELTVAHHAGNALIALLADSDGPFHRSRPPDPLLEIGTHLGQVVREDVCRA